MFKVDKQYQVPELMKQLDDIEVKFDSSTGMATALTSYQIEFVRTLVDKTQEDLRQIVDNVEATKLVQYILGEKHANKLALFRREGGTITGRDETLQFTYSKRNKNLQDYLTVFKSFVSEMAKMQVNPIDAIKNVENTDKKVEPQEARQWCEEIEKEFQNDCCVYNEEENVFITFCAEYGECLKMKNFLLVKLGKREVKTKGRARSHGNTAGLHQSIDQTRCDGKMTFTLNGLQVFVYKANICDLKVDCIVNAANETLQHGGGVALAISRAAGEKLEKEGQCYIKKNGYIKTGHVCSTTAGNLPYRCVIHAVGPAWYHYRPHNYGQVKQCCEDLFCAVINSLLEADNQGLSRIALPAISSGKSSIEA